MAPRLELQTLLEGITDNVYFQPPENINMQYPCIVYNRDFAETEFAGNGPYTVTLRYMVTVIDRNPDSDIPGKVAMLPMCVFNRFFTADSLNHDVYTLFF
jgi:hypothetical protein